MTVQPIAQGEISCFPLAALPDNLQSKAVEPIAAGFIISHSESGNHHLLERNEGVTVLERTSEVPEGMRILYAILKEPTRLYQDAGNAHGEHVLQPGTYEFRIAREHDEFMQQARMVAD